MSAQVYSYDDGAHLSGTPTERLVRESAAAGSTGAVPAYLDGDEWHYVEPSRAADYRRMGHDVVTVWVQT